MSLGLLKGIEDYAKSNRCLGQLATDYRLEDWAAGFPRIKEKLAMFFEVYIGSVFLERRVWDDNPLELLEGFFDRLWAVRFRDIHSFSHRRWSKRLKMPLVEEKRDDVEVNCTEVKYPDSPLCIRSRLNVGGVTTRKIGHIAKATYAQLSGEEQNNFEVFHRSKDKARDLARRLSASRGTKFATSF